VAALTDLLDGVTGRLLHACSRMGRVLDPLADKMFVIGVVTAFLWRGELSFVEVILIGLRDWTIILGSAVWLAWRPGSFRLIAPTLLGKATTVAQFSFFVVLLILPEYRGPSLAATTSLSGLAAGDYIWLFLRQPAQERSPNSRG
jgi:phosphatidylglycerophosphate synthase